MGDMVNVYKGMQQRLQQVSLSQRLILGLVVALIAIIIFSGLPANIAMWVQLERQVWGRVEDAQAATQALYENEIARLAKRPSLFAGRPTLQRMIEENDTIGLASYLETLQVESGNLDVIQVVTPDFQVGDVQEELPNPEAFLDGTNPRLPIL